MNISDRLKHLEAAAVAVPRREEHDELLNLLTVPELRRLREIMAPVPELPNGRPDIYKMSDADLEEVETLMRTAESRWE